MSKSFLITHKTNIRGYLSFLTILPAIIFQIRNWSQYLQTYGDRYQGIIHFRDGFKLYVADSSDISSISTSFFRKDYGSLNPNWKSIIDIGAHKGFFTTFAARSSPQANIYSYEPIKSSFQSLNKNVRLNNLQQRVKTFNLGVAGEAGERVINLTVSSTDNTFYTEIGSVLKGKQKIKCLTLEKIIADNLLRHIDLLKLDCEGAEFEILMMSGKKTFQIIKEIRMEYHNIDQQKNINRLKSFLKKSGYQLLEQRKSTNPNIGYARFMKK